MHCVLGTHVIYVVPSGHAVNAVCRMGKLSTRPLYECSPYTDPAFASIAQCGEEACGCRTNDYLQKSASREAAEDFLEHFLLKRERLENEGQYLFNIKK